MDIQYWQGAAEQAEADVLVSVAFDKEGDSHPLGSATGNWISDVYTSGEFGGKSGEVIVLHRPSGMKAKRLALVGAGSRDKFDPNELRKAAGVAVRNLKGRSLRKITFSLREGFDSADHVRALVEGAVLGDFEPDQLKTDPKKADKRLESFTVAAGSAGMEDAVREGRIIADAQNFTRELVNLPANRMTPLVLADRARSMAAEFGLECEVLDRDRMTQLGMGSLLGVAQGSAEPPALIILRYKVEGSTDHLGLVGKGVTFDTGGVSIKPADGMEKMKYDMAGGAAVIGAMRAIAQLKPGVTVTGFVPAVENMVSDRAQRPGDIVTSLNGKTVEVLNTDAEGRLILIDALTYAIRQGCTHLVDAATLTGAIAVALGHIYAGAFTNSQALLDKFLGAAKAQGERYWQLPLDDDYKDYLKSAFADLPNIGGRWGGSITAAYFLKEFVEDKPWIHLDIAGTAWLDEAKPFLAKGPSGMCVRTFVELARNW